MRLKLIAFSTGRGGGQPVPISPGASTGTGAREGERCEPTVTHPNCTRRRQLRSAAFVRRIFSCSWPAGTPGDTPDIVGRTGAFAAPDRQGLSVSQALCLYALILLLAVFFPGG